MSSVVAFLRALVMVACLVAVPVLAISQGSTISRGLQAAARFLDRISADHEEEADVPVATGALRSARPAPIVANADQVADSTGAAAAGMLPEPMEDGRAERHVTPGVAGPDSPGAKPASDASLLPSAPRTSPAPPQMAAWQEMASNLQQLGALEYALEKWGDSGELYRFRCLAAVPGTSSYQRHFHAVDADGGRAVERVVEQVRAWRTSAPGAK